MKRTRILVLPSWYPTQRNPTVGCFFQEQAALLSSEFDVRVLVGEAHPVGYRSAWRQWRWVPRPRRARVTRIAESEPGQTPHTAILEYHWRSTTEMDALAATVDAHAQVIEIWHRSGWRADLIHALSAEDGGVIGLQLARRFGLPMVLTEHQVFSPVHHSAEKRRRILEALNEANILIAVSNHQLRCLYLQGVERPMLVVGNLIDETAFPFQPVKVRDVFRILRVRS